MFDREIALYLSIKYVNVSRHVFLNLKYDDSYAYVQFSDSGQTQHIWSPSMSEATSADPIKGGHGYASGFIREASEIRTTDMDETRTHRPEIPRARSCYRTSREST